MWKSQYVYNISTRSFGIHAPQVRLYSESICASIINVGDMDTLILIIYGQKARPPQIHSTRHPGAPWESQSD